MSTTMHQLKIFPVPFASEPAEIVDIPEGVILGEWLSKNVRNFNPDTKGVETSIPYNSTVLGDVYLYAAPPEGSAISSILKPILKVLGLAPAKPKTQKQVRGSELELASFQGNQVKYGEVVREAFGMNKIFGDIIVPRYRYFANKKDHWGRILLCVGVDEYDVPLSLIRLAETPIVGLGADAYVKVYKPGESLANEACAQWWHTSDEVGATSSGSGGLPLETNFAATPTAPEGLYSFSGKSIVPIGGQQLPEDWANGMYLDIDYLHSYAVSGNTLSGTFSGLQVEAGDTVTLDGDYVGDYTVESYIPESGGTPGSASVWTATAAPSLEYSAQPAQFFINSGTISAIVTVDEDYTSEPELVSDLNSSLSQTPLNGLVEFEAGLIIRDQPPYSGRRITVNDVSGAGRLFGNISAANTATVVGAAGASGGDAQLALVGFAADAPVVELSIQRTGYRFVITAVSPAIVTVELVDSNNDSDWLGWGAGFETLDTAIALGADSTTGGLRGVYKATPGDELCTALEWDVMFPQGLLRVNKKGRHRAVTVTVGLQYRSSPADPWTVEMRTYTETSKDQVAFTERVEFPTPRRITEVAMWRTTPESRSADTSNKVEWFGLKCRIADAPTVYPQFTTIAVSIKGSSALGTAADEMISAVATRVLDGVPERRISKAVEHIARRASVDTAELSRLENEVWTPRDDTFDFSFEKPATIKQAANTALSVGFSDFTLEDGIMKPVREALVDPSLIHVYRQTFSARNTLKGSLRSTYELFSEDETDCIDVKYIDSRTWRVEIVRCKEGDPNEPPRKVEEMEADGITDRDKAFQWGMRKLMEIKTESTRHRCKTELDALNCGYGSYVNFVREIPGWSQSSRVKSVAGLVLTTVDNLDWQEEGDHVVALRRPDGTMSEIQNAERIEGNSILVSQLWSFDPTPIETNVFFGIRQRFATPAIVRQVKPSGMTVDVSAIGYNPEKYQYDDAEANN